MESVALVLSFLHMSLCSFQMISVMVAMIIMMLIMMMAALTIMTEMIICIKSIIMSLEGVEEMGCV